ncbi:copper resistance protein CopC [Paenibacillus sp. Marseille-Q4541]|uniref:copper resistance CopC family protein n=1 Tax=Paenibacillus sp. Marseille-Q4541 TaxID=2831522 RepID=UPI001BA4BAC8|nr:copper resistance protein CopC [Paenibacillus sp. Marseille-Q4541]
MMKKGILTLVLFLMLMPGAAFAHTGLENATPGDGETVTTAVNELVLQFETAIEPLSEVKVVNEQGNEVELADIEINKDTLTGKLNEPLPNGKYTVNWTIVGEDGHTISNKYAFTVNVPEAPAETEQPNDTATEEGSTDGDTPVTNEDTTGQANNDNTAAPKDDVTPVQEANNTGNTGIWIALVVVVIVAGAYVVVRRKGKK